MANINTAFDIENPLLAINSASVDALYGPFTLKQLGFSNDVLSLSTADFSNPSKGVLLAIIRTLRQVKQKDINSSWLPEIGLTTAIFLDNTENYQNSLKEFWYLGEGVGFVLKNAYGNEGNGTNVPISSSYLVAVNPLEIKIPVDANGKCDKNIFELLAKFTIYTYLKDIAIEAGECYCTIQIEDINGSIIEDPGFHVEGSSINKVNFDKNSDHIDISFVCDESTDSISITNTLHAVVRINYDYWSAYLLVRIIPETKGYTYKINGLPSVIAFDGDLDFPEIVIDVDKWDVRNLNKLSYTGNEGLTTEVKFFDDYLRPHLLSLEQNIDDDACLLTINGLTKFVEVPEGSTYIKDLSLYGMRSYMSYGNYISVTVKDAIGVSARETFPIIPKDSMVGKVYSSYEFSMTGDSNVVIARGVKENENYLQEATKTIIQGSYLGNPIDIKLTELKLAGLRSTNASITLIPKVGDPIIKENLTNGTIDLGTTIVVGYYFSAIDEDCVVSIKAKVISSTLEEKECTLVLRISFVDSGTGWHLSVLPDSIYINQDEKSHTENVSFTVTCYGDSNKSYTENSNLFSIELYDYINSRWSEILFSSNELTIPVKIEKSENYNHLLYRLKVNGVLWNSLRIHIQEIPHLDNSIGIYCSNPNVIIDDDYVDSYINTLLDVDWIYLENGKEIGSINKLKNDPKYAELLDSFELKVDYHGYDILQYYFKLTQGDNKLNFVNWDNSTKLAIGLISLVAYINDRPYTLQTISIVNINKGKAWKLLVSPDIITADNSEVTINVIEYNSNKTPKHVDFLNNVDNLQVLVNNDSTLIDWLGTIGSITVSKDTTVTLKYNNVIVDSQPIRRVNNGSSPYHLELNNDTSLIALTSDNYDIRTATEVTLLLLLGASNITNVPGVKFEAVLSLQLQNLFDVVSIHNKFYLLKKPGIEFIPTLGYVTYTAITPDNLRINKKHNVQISSLNALYLLIVEPNIVYTDDAGYCVPSKVTATLWLILNGSRTDITSNSNVNLKYNYAGGAQYNILNGDITINPSKGKVLTVKAYVQNNSISAIALQEVSNGLVFNDHVVSTNPVNDGHYYIKDYYCLVPTSYTSNPYVCVRWREALPVTQTPIWKSDEEIYNLLYSYGTVSPESGVGLVSVSNVTLLNTNSRLFEKVNSNNYSKVAISLLDLIHPDQLVDTESVGLVVLGKPGESAKSGLVFDIHNENVQLDDNCKVPEVFLFQNAIITVQHNGTRLTPITNGNLTNKLFKLDGFEILSRTGFDSSNLNITSEILDSELLSLVITNVSSIKKGDSLIIDCNIKAKIDDIEYSLKLKWSFIVLDYNKGETYKIVIDNPVINTSYDGTPISPKNELGNNIDNLTRLVHVAIFGGNLDYVNLTLKDYDIIPYVNGQESRDIGTISLDGKYYNINLNSLSELWSLYFVLKVNGVIYDTEAFTFNRCGLNGTSAAMLVNRGEWKFGETYYHTDLRVDLVYVDESTDHVNFLEGSEEYTALNDQKRIWFSCAKSYNVTSETTPAHLRALVENKYFEMADHLYGFIVSKLLLSESINAINVSALEVLVYDKDNPLDSIAGLTPNNDSAIFWAGGKLDNNPAIQVNKDGRVQVTGDITANTFSTKPSNNDVYITVDDGAILFYKKEQSMPNFLGGFECDNEGNLTYRDKSNKVFKLNELFSLIHDANRYYKVCPYTITLENNTELYDLEFSTQIYYDESGKLYTDAMHTNSYSNKKFFINKKHIPNVDILDTDYIRLSTNYDGNVWNYNSGSIEGSFIRFLRPIDLYIFEYCETDNLGLICVLYPIAYSASELRVALKTDTFDKSGNPQKISHRYWFICAINDIRTSTAVIWDIHSLFDYRVIGYAAGMSKDSPSKYKHTLGNIVANVKKLHTAVKTSTPVTFTKE